jgi:hypothetical protein
MNGRTDHAKDPAKKASGQTPAEREHAARTQAERGVTPGPKVTPDNPSPKVTPENSVLREQAKAADAGDRKKAEELERARVRHDETTRRVEQQEVTKEVTMHDEGGRLYGERHAEHRHGIGGNGSAATASIPTLLRDLAHDATEITRKEVALARSEMVEAIEGVKTGVISMAAGGGVLFAGILFLLLAATLALGTVMAGWLAALIVGGLVTLVGAIMVAAGKRKMQASNFRPDRTIDSMHKDREMIERRTR